MFGSLLFATCVMQILGHPPFFKVRSRWEKVGSGLGLLLGVIGFNLLLPFLFEK